jgi:hypothetical protein
MCHVAKVAKASTVSVDVTDIFSRYTPSLYTNLYDKYKTWMENLSGTKTLAYFVALS